MNAVRHSPSNTIATLPVSKAFVGLNSEFVYVAKNFSRFEYPYQSTSDFCHWNACRPGRVGGELGLAARVEPVRAERVPDVGDVELLPQVERHEAGHLDRAVGVLHGQLLGIRGELGHRLGRAADPGLLEHLLVVVEAVGVGQRRQRALLARDLRVAERRRCELADRHVVLLHERRQVFPQAARAVLAGVAAA